MTPRFFATPLAFRRWLEQHHAKAEELLVGFWKKDSGKPSITWSESVDQALCFGWIDGVRRGRDADSYTIRFTPRRASSTWSQINVRKVAALTAAGLMQPAGTRAFEQRKAAKTGVYSFEQRETAALDAAMERTFRARKKAWAFWEACPPGFRRLVTWWVVSAKREETRAKRLAKLIAESAAGRRVI